MGCGKHAECVAAGDKFECQCPSGMIGNAQVECSAGKYHTVTYIGWVGGRLYIHHCIAIREFCIFNNILAIFFIESKGGFRKDFVSTT